MEVSYKVVAVTPLDEFLVNVSLEPLEGTGGVQLSAVSKSDVSDFEVGKQVSGVFNLSKAVTVDAIKTPTKEISDVNYAR